MWYSHQYYCNLSCGGGSVMVAMRLSQGPWNSFLTPLYYLLAHCGNKHFRKICCNKKRSHGFTLEEGRFQLNIRKKCLILEEVKHCRFPERWWMLHSWKHSRQDWGGLWAMWSSWSCRCSLQRGWTRWLWKVPSIPNCSVILGKKPEHSTNPWVAEPRMAMCAGGFIFPQSGNTMRS